MALLTLAEAKSQLHIPTTDTSVDTELQTYCDAATDAVERYTAQYTTARSVSQVIRAVGGQVLAVDHGPVTSVDSIEALDGSRTWDTSSMTGDGSLIYLAGARITGMVRVTYTAGLDDPPAAYQLAAWIIVQHLWETRRGTGGIITDELDDSLQISGLGFAIPNRALELLGAPAAGVA